MKNRYQCDGRRQGVLVALLLSWGISSVAATGGAGVTATPGSGDLTAEPIATVTNNSNKDVSHLSLLVDGQQAVQGISFETLHGDQSPPTQSASQFAMPEIESQSGVVLDLTKGYKTIILSGSIDSSVGSGKLELRFLTNAIFSSYRTCPVTVQRGTDMHWSLVGAGGALINAIVVQVGTFGIKTLQNICH